MHAFRIRCTRYLQALVIEISIPICSLKLKLNLGNQLRSEIVDSIALIQKIMEQLIMDFYHESEDESHQFHLYRVIIVKCKKVPIKAALADRKKVVNGNLFFQCMSFCAGVYFFLSFRVTYIFPWDFQTCLNPV